MTCPCIPIYTCSPQLSGWEWSLRSSQLPWGTTQTMAQKCVLHGREFHVEVLGVHVWMFLVTYQSPLCQQQIWWYQGGDGINIWEILHVIYVLTHVKAWVYLCRLVAIMLISIAVHATFLCEQPAGSVFFPNHPRLSWLCNRVAFVP